MHALAVQWAGHAGRLWELHEQELSRLNNDRREKNRQQARTLALLTKQLGEERARSGAAAAQERDSAAVQLRAAQEASGPRRNIRLLDLYTLCRYKSKIEIR